MAETFEKIVETIKGLVPFKEQAKVGDLILIVKETEPGQVDTAYARIRQFAREVKHRSEWWRVGLTILKVPLVHFTMIVNADQLTGKEIFTIGGQKVLMRAVDSDPESGEGATAPNFPSQGDTGSRLGPAQPRRAILTLIKP